MTGEGGFFDLVLNQRAHRQLKPDPVPDELIGQILTAATHAPSAENRQPWLFIVVRRAETRHQIGELARQLWDAGGRAYSEARLTPRMLADVDAWVHTGLAGAPVHLVVAGDSMITSKRELPSSIFPAVQNMLLAAAALGLGSLLSTLPIHTGPAFAELLNLPDHVVPQALIPIGYPARELKSPRRIPASEKTFYERHPDGRSSIS